MSGTTGIEWTDATWNPVTGCTEVSPGCDHCYAKTFAERWRGTEGHYFERGFDVQLRPAKLTEPLRWKKPRKIFVNSMSDLFHDQVPHEYIAQVWAIMALAPQHTFQILTKRHARMRTVLNSDGFREAMHDALLNPWAENLPVDDQLLVDAVNGCHPAKGPLPNVWLGVSAENQQWADIRIPALLDTPAAVRWVSAEPLLGPIDLYKTWRPKGPELNWVVVGGESGRGARPMHPQWARSLRDQCIAAGVPFLFKQWGQWRPTRWFQATQSQGATHVIKIDGSFRKLGYGETVPDGAAIQRVGKKAAGRLLDGRFWDQYPKAVSA